MKIDKAIEILEDLLGEGPQFPPTDRRIAVNLGIEALERINVYHEDDPLLKSETLPGED